MQGYLVWEVPDRTVSVLVHRSVLDHLKEIAQDAFSGAFGDLGGWLLGRAENSVEGGHRVVTIENFQGDLSSLPGEAPVGFVRFRRQKMLHLEEPDFQELKASPGMVCLMVRPDTNRGAVGGFFYREGKTIRYPEVSSVFPIDGRAADCRGIGHIVTEEPDVPAPAPGRRVLYATVGLALMLSSFAIWLVGR